MIDRNMVVKKKKIGFGTLTLITVLAVFLAVIGSMEGMRMVGKAALSVTVSETGAVPQSAREDTAKESETLYRGNSYVLNEDLVTALVMGIDKETVTRVGGQSWTAEEMGGYTGGQADALFLLVINPHKKNISVIAINRNAMADVDVFDEEGNYQGVYTKQIALQHGYGTGGEESCLRQVKAVSRMFHDIPIHVYAAVSMDAIPELNDVLGGITVEVLDDIIYPEYDMDLHQGETVTLNGEKAYWYVRLRNENAFNSNELRLQRQKQYLTTFAAQAKNRSVKDVRVAIKLYQAASKYTVTNVDLNKFTYMATEYLNYDFDVKNLYSLQGEVIQGNQFEEFYVDEDALLDLIMKVFYEPAE